VFFDLHTAVKANVLLTRIYHLQQKEIFKRISFMPPKGSISQGTFPCKTVPDFSKYYSTLASLNIFALYNNQGNLLHVDIGEWLTSYGWLL